MKHLILFFSFLSLCTLTSGQKNLLQAGPMNGYVTAKEASIWVQTTESAEVQIEYWSTENPDNKLSTEKSTTKKENGYTTTLIANKVQPGTNYNYQLKINGQAIQFDYPCKIQVPKLWQWREQPPEFSILTGSCMYISEKAFDRPGNPYGGDYQILAEMAKHDASLMLWLGDNTYYREVDWTSKTGIYYRNTHTRSVPELQPLLSKMHHIAIWDDHDYGPNDAVGSFYNKNLTQQAFKDFWANPNSNVSGETGISGQYEFNDIGVFMLDNRWNRTPKYDSLPREMLGQAQIDWLISALKDSKASFKLVMLGSQFLNPLEVYENTANYPNERDYILEQLEKEQIKNVIFLTGDRHHSEISKLELDNGITVYDITASPLTSRAHKAVKEENPIRIDCSLIKERNFTKLTVSGEFRKRTIAVQYFSSDGALIFEHKINQQEK